MIEAEKYFQGRRPSNGTAHGLKREKHFVDVMKIHHLTFWSKFGFGQRLQRIYNILLPVLCYIGALLVNKDKV